VQLRYGEDGLDAMWVEEQNIPTMKPNNQLFERDFKMDLGNDRWLKKFYSESIIRDITVWTHRLCALNQ